MEKEKQDFRLSEQGNVSRQKQNKKGGKGFLIFLLVLIIIAGVLFVLWKKTDVLNPLLDKIKNKRNVEEHKEEKKEEPKVVKIINEESKTRPFAVMIDNHEGALSQAGVNDAQVIYEIVVEGGISRLLAIFKDVDVKEIGPVRSARHYFLDYAKEYDAILAHEGYSPRAASEIRSRNIDSVVYTQGLWHRVSSRNAPHNAMTSTKRIKDAANKRKYALTTNTKWPLKYSPENVELNNSFVADEIKTKISNYTDIVYKYNKETEKYEKYEHKMALKDSNTNKPMAATNLIFLYADNFSLIGFGAGHGRQEFDTTQEMKGYYITKGKAIKITASKSTRDSKTKYYDEDNNEIVFNDGNTFITFIPKRNNINIIDKTPKVEENKVEAE